MLGDHVRLRVGLPGLIHRLTGEVVRVIRDRDALVAKRRADDEVRRCACDRKQDAGDENDQTEDSGRAPRSVPGILASQWVMREPVITQARCVGVAGPRRRRGTLSGESPQLGAPVHALDGDPGSRRANTAAGTCPGCCYDKQRGEQEKRRGDPSSRPFRRRSRRRPRESAIRRGGPPPPRPGRRRERSRGTPDHRESQHRRGRTRCLRHQEHDDADRRLLDEARDRRLAGEQRHPRRRRVFRRRAPGTPGEAAGTSTPGIVSRPFRRHSTR